MKINLNEIESKVDNTLEKETPDSLTNWLKIKKQQRLEEAAENHWKMQYIMALDKSTKPYIIQDFIAGTKWQAERMYSEEEIINIHKKWNIFNENQDSFNGKEDLTFEEWFKKFESK